MTVSMSIQVSPDAPTSILTTRKELPGHRLRWDMFLEKNQTSNAFPPLKIAHFHSLSPVRQNFLGSIYKIFSQIRDLLYSFAFFSRNFLPREHSSFFFLFSFLLQDWESTYPLLKRKKKSHLGKSGVGRLGVLTISPWSILIVLSFFLFGFKVLWYYEKQQKKKLLHKSSKR